MSVVRSQVRRGAYFDSVVLLRIQRAVLEVDGVVEAGIAMATPANREILAEAGLFDSATEAHPDDLVIAVRARDEAAAHSALGRVEELLRSRRGEDESSEESDPRPRSLEVALRQAPESNWVLISVPGRYAASVARGALAAGRNVFLYSDNVTLAEEVALKREAESRGLLVLGPDCGTALVGGAGLGFANRVRRGAIGIVAASGTGLQTVASRVHESGDGISHAFGTGGRDLAAEVGGSSALAALSVLAGDAATRVIVLISKPPAPEVATRLLAEARDCGKPVVVHFIGHAPPARRLGDLHFASSLADAADLAVELVRSTATVVGEEEASSTLARSARPPLLGGENAAPTPENVRPVSGAPVGTTFAEAAATSNAEAREIVTLSPSTQKGRVDGDPEGRERRELAPKLVRGLFSGGTLAYEALLALRAVLGRVDSNLSPEDIESDGHRVLDLGADEFTVGRPHPMIDPDFLIRQVRAEAGDARVGVLLLDVVLGDGAHPDPAAGLAPVIREAVDAARAEGRELRCLVVLVGTDDDPQDRAAQAERLHAAGAEVLATVEEAVLAAWRAVAPPAVRSDPGERARRVDLIAPVAAINVGVELFHDALRAQGVECTQVDWRPPARGNERLAAILERMRG